MADSIYASEALPNVSPELEELKPPLDFSHYYSRVTKARKESSMKRFYKYFSIPGIENLAGGMYQDS